MGFMTRICWGAYFKDETWTPITEREVRERLAARVITDESTDEAMLALARGEVRRVGVYEIRYVEDEMRVAYVGDKLTFLNRYALEELIKAAKRLTREPLTYTDYSDHAPDGDNERAVCCGVMDSDVYDENRHADNCAWRLLREALANLDNEGYTVC